jgi:hypothetical protein
MVSIVSNPELQAEIVFILVVAVNTKCSSPSQLSAVCPVRTSPHAISMSGSSQGTAVGGAVPSSHVSSTL